VLLKVKRRDNMQTIAASAKYKAPAIKSLAEAFMQAKEYIAVEGLKNICVRLGSSRGMGGLPLPSKGAITSFDANKKKIILELEKYLIELKEDAPKDANIKTIGKLLKVLRDKNKTKEYLKYLKVLNKNQEGATTEIRQFIKAIKKPSGFNKKIVTNGRDYNTILEDENKRIEMHISWIGSDPDKTPFVLVCTQKGTGAILCPSISGSLSDYEDPNDMLKEFLDKIELPNQNMVALPVENTTYYISPTKLENIKKKLKNKGVVNLPPKSMGRGYRVTVNKEKGSETAPPKLKKILELEGTLFTRSINSEE
jgi:hypothetical protein